MHSIEKQILIISHSKLHISPCLFSLVQFSGIAACYRNTKLIQKLQQPNLLKCSSIDVLKEFRDGEVTILFGKEFQVWITLFKKKLSLIVAHEQKLFLFLELIDSLRILRLFPRINSAGPDISKFFLRSSGFTQLIFSLLLITL